MADRTEFEFVIDGFTPDTLPMARLAEYLSDLANLFGEKERVHFVRVGEGSASLVHRVEDVAVPKVRTRVHNARVLDSWSEERRAFEALDHKLRADNATGELLEAGAREKKRLLFFPGRTRDVDPVYGPFNEKGTLTGRVISVGGKRSPVNVNIRDGENIHYCEATYETALQLAPADVLHRPSTSPSRPGPPICARRPCRALGDRPAEPRPRALMTRHSLREARPRRRIPLVEDNRVNQLVATRLLEKEGHTVVRAGNGREALAILEAASFAGFDGILMDVQMPEMDGFECTAVIRAREQSGHPTFRSSR